jgi:Protein of unknown function (DUF3038)
LTCDRSAPTRTAANQLLEAFNPLFYSQMMSASTPKLDDLVLTSKLDSSQLERITAELDAIIVSIAALTQIDRLEMQHIAQDLRLESIVSDWINEWSIERSSSNQQLNVQQIRALVLIVNYLAQTHQALIRRNIHYWHQTVKYEQLPLQSPALADYIGNFITIYQVRLHQNPSESFEALSVTALDLLVGLLFYGSSNGHQRLWTALLKRSHRTVG